MSELDVVLVLTAVHLIMRVGSWVWGSSRVHRWRWNRDIARDIADDLRRHPAR